MSQHIKYKHDSEGLPPPPTVSSQDSNSSFGSDMIVNGVQADSLIEELDNSASHVNPGAIEPLVFDSNVWADVSITKYYCQTFVVDPV